MTAGFLYSFVPFSTDPDGNAVTFSVTNLPSWARFDPASGTVSGTPAPDEVGVFSDILISASDGSATVSLPRFEIAVTGLSGGTGNDPPAIRGEGRLVASVGSFYRFSAAATDPEDGILGYSIAGRPSWAVFDTRTGELSGTPDDTHVGVHSDIRISVSDGIHVVSLPPFSIEVMPAYSALRETVTLAWQRPTSNMDGSLLTDLVGYRIHFGRGIGNLEARILVADPEASGHVFSDEFLPGNWYFAVTALNSVGGESPPSNIVTKTFR